MEENGDEADEDDDDEDDMDETDIEGLLDAEFDEDEDPDEEEEETEEDAVDRLRSEIVDRFDEDNARLGVVQVLYRTVLGGGGDETPQYGKVFHTAGLPDFTRIYEFARHFPQYGIIQLLWKIKIHSILPCSFTALPNTELYI